MKTSTLSRVLFIFMLVVSSIQANARKFYFSNAGNDTYSITQAQNPATPWKTLRRLQTFGNSGSAMAGDTFAFKRGEVFTSGVDDFGSFKWWAIVGYTCPSGTSDHPIVFTNYGDAALERPNFLFPYPATTRSQDKYVLTFEGVGYITIDGLQFNDTRFPVNDKISSAYTAAGLVLGELPVAQRTHHMEVKNCNFSNIGYGIISCGNYMKITNNTFTNFKSVGDTIGMNDIGADPMVPSGKYYTIKNNYFSGSWAYANPNSSSDGLLGGALETIDDFDSSSIMYNTFVDCSGGMEFGQISGSQYGPNDDTFAYNLFLNVRVVAYANTGSSPFSCQAARLHYWNNVIIENNNSRFSGTNFGNDVMGDGQSFHNFHFWPTYPLNQNTNGGSRVFQYTSDAGLVADTLYDIRNNIIWNSTREQVIYDNSRTKFKHANNIYKLAGGSTLGGTLGSGEIIATAPLFMDTTNQNPLNWDFHLLSNSQAINWGRSVGIGADFDGQSISGNPDAGVYEFQSGTNSTITAASTFNPIACFGGTTTVNITATGGTAPYSGTGNFTVSAGTHNYIVIDAAGIRDTVTLVISQPTAITISISTGTITTTGGTTSVQATATGGTGNGYTYSLNNSVYQNSGIFSNVAAGSYVMNVKDANGCVATKNFTINAPVISALVLSATTGTINCFGSTTTVSVAATGGVPPYTGTGTFTLAAGTHNFTVTDANGTSQTITRTITSPTQILIVATAGTITVAGGSTNITVSASGGTGAKTYKLDNGSYQTSNVFNAVLAGVHTIYVKDANNCIQSSSISITQPQSIPLAVSLTSGTIFCNGTTTTITVTATGGTPPYTGTGSFTVAAGSYNYTVTDANNTTANASIVVGQPLSLNIAATSGNIAVVGGTTSINVTASGGTSPYTYRINNGVYQSATLFNNVSAGNHTVTVRDANGCTKSSAVMVNQPNAALNANITSGTIACNGGTTNVTVTATGGTAPYVGTGTFTVAAGLHNYTVTDANGINYSTSITITQPSVLIATGSATAINGVGGTSTLTITASGGTAPYNYSINNGAYQSTNTYNNLPAGNYAIIVKDANGCVANNSVSISQPIGNPLNVTATNTNISCFGGTSMVVVSATGGLPPYTGVGTFTAAAGTRTFTVRDAAGVTQSTTITTTQPTEITVTVNVASDILFNGGTTTVSILASGGAGNYRYSVDGGVSQTTPNFRSIGAGSHFATVVDASGCLKQVLFTVNQVESPNAIAIRLVNKTDVTCRGKNDGTIEVIASGGRAPYSYKIDNGNYGINFRFYNVTPGVHRVYAKDANGNITNLLVMIKDGRRRCPGTGRSANLVLTTTAYPNPSNSFFNLTIDSESEEDVVIDIMDLNGKKIFTEKGSIDKTFTFGNNFKPGIYFVRVVQGLKANTVKIIKQ